MERAQRYKHEMLVRVRDFGAAHRELFPDSSSGGVKFAQVAAAVAAIDLHLKNRALGRVQARGVSAVTRAAVSKYMSTLAKAARRIMRRLGRDDHPFVMPKGKTHAELLAAGRVFLEQAAKWEAEFIELGLPQTFLSDFGVLMNGLIQSADGRLNGKTMRAEAQAGVAHSLRRGHDIVRDLDVIVEIATREDAILAAAWRAARRIEGQASSGAEATQPVAATPETSSPGPTDEGQPATLGNVATVEAPVLVLEKAS